MTAPAILPQQINGGVAVVTDGSGVPQPVAGAPANMSFVATLPATFTVGTAGCPRTFHTTDCNFRVTGDQMNALESELLLLAAEFNPDGAWTCGIGNLAANFAAFLTSRLPGIVAATFLKCDGSAHQVADQIPTCAEMAAAIAAAIASIPMDKFMITAAYDDPSNTLTFTMSDGATVPVNLGSLIADILDEVVAGPSTDANNLIQTGTDGKSFLSSCDVFDGAAADPRPDVNAGMRIVGVDTGDPLCPDVKFEVATYAADLEGAGVAGQESGLQKIMTVDTIAPVVRFDDTNIVNGFGFAAAASNTGNNVSAYGHSAAQNNTGDTTSAYGYGAALSNTGVTVSAYGYLAATNNTGNIVGAYGYVAAQNNTGNNLSAYGHSAARSNTGDIVSAYGYFAALSNTGDTVSAYGYGAATNNTGNNVDAYGFGAARNNTGSNVSAYGYEAALSNTGDVVSASGRYAAYNNSSDSVDAFGDFAGTGPLLTNETGITVTAATATSVTISPPTAAPIGSTVTLSVNASTIANLVSTTRSFTVTSPTSLALIVGAAGSGSGAPLLGTTGAAAGAQLIRTPSNFTNNSYFGRNSQGTGPNQAVLGGPTQTPCGWAPFLNISDARDKLIVEDYDAGGRGIAFLNEIRLTAFRYDHRERYVEKKVESAEIDVVEEISVPAELPPEPVEPDTSGMTKGQAKKAMADYSAALEKWKSLPRTVTKEVSRKERREWVVASEVKKDGSRACPIVRYGFTAQNIQAAAKRVKIDFHGVRDMAKEGGSDKLLFEDTSLIADLVLAVQQLSVENAELRSRLDKAKL
jgi:hypothetical protein